MVNYTYGLSRIYYTVISYNDENSEQPAVTIKDWMLICQHRAQSNIDDHKCDWSLAAKGYPNLLEMSSFITNQRRESVPQCVLKRADPTGKQLEAYEMVREHFESKTHRSALCVWHGRNGI